MIRTQIRLEPAQHRRLKELAAHRSTSIAQLIREGVDQVLLRAEDGALWDRFLSSAGSFRATGAEQDVSAKHDRYLEDAFR